MTKTTELRLAWLSIIVLLGVFWTRLFCILFNTWPVFLHAKYQIIVSRWFDIIAVPAFICLVLLSLSYEEQYVHTLPDGERQISVVPVVIAFFALIYGCLFGFAYATAAAVIIYIPFCVLRALLARIGA